MARRGIEHELAALRTADPHTPEGRALVLSGLRSPSGHVVAAAAALAEQHRLDVATTLVDAFARLLVDPIKRDPGCSGKLSVVSALDELGHRDTDVHLTAARHVQREPVWGGSEDTAGSLRARAAVALMNQCDPELLLVLADHLADPIPYVRAAAADTLAASGDHAAVPLLVLAMHRVEPEPEVRIALARGLLELDPDVALPRLAIRLRTDDAEVSSTALGLSRIDSAVPVLTDWLDELVLGSDRELAITALGLHRSEPARDALLDLVATSHRREAAMALEALSGLSSDPRTQVLAAAAVARSEHDLTQTLATAFPRS